MIENDEPDVMRQKVQEWKRMHKEKHPDLDFDMFTKIIEAVNSASPIKIARNPLDEDHDWIPDTTCYNIREVSVDDQGRLVFSIRLDKTEYSVEKMLDTLKDMKRKKQGPSRYGNLMARIDEKKTVQLTDIYSHALVKDSWAGLPFDVVLAYYEEDSKEEKKSE